jgi:prepilin-type N-terminal cleavage/methylation domain-containing protein
VSAPRARPGFTIVEIMIGAAILSLLAGIAYQAFHLVFSADSRHGVTAMTRKSFMQKDAKAGLRRLTYRLREAIQILDPAPGRSGPSLTFRDISNEKVRLRLDGAASRLYSERERNGSWAAETDPVTVATPAGRVAASWPVAMLSCSSIQFTVLSPECVSIRAGLMIDGQLGSYMTIVQLRNAGISF